MRASCCYFFTIGKATRASPAMWTEAEGQLPSTLSPRYHTSLRGSYIIKRNRPLGAGPTALKRSVARLTAPVMAPPGW